MSLLIVLIFISLGWFIGKKIFNVNDKGDELETAKKLVDTYVDIISNGDDTKIYIAYESVDEKKLTTGFVDCIKELGDHNDAIVHDDNGNNSVYFGHYACISSDFVKQVNYNDLNETYKYLFGSDKNIDRKDAESGYNGYLLAYSNLNNSFIELEIQSSWFGAYNIYVVDSTKIKDDKLIANVLYSNPSEFNFEEFKSPYSDVWYKYEEKQKYIDENLKYFDKYEFIFKYENNHYILSNIAKK